MPPIDPNANANLTGTLNANLNPTFDPTALDRNRPLFPNGAPDASLFTSDSFELFEPNAIANLVATAPGRTIPDLSQVRAGQQVLRVGDSGPGVQELRDQLRSLGFNVGGQRGVYTEQVASAVTAFQRAYRLQENGQVGQQTLNFLGWASDGLRGSIPTGQVKGVDGYPSVRVPVGNYTDLGTTLQITGGFNEKGLPIVRDANGNIVSGDHNPKGEIWTIYGNNPNHVDYRPPGTGSNLGIDYVARDRNGRPIQDLSTWFNGRVVSIGIAEKYGGTPEQAAIAGPWGRRVAIETDLTYSLNGKEYPIYVAYGHLDRIDVQVGQQVRAGQIIGEMGGASGDKDANGKPLPASYRYPEHGDMRTYIYDRENNRLIDIDPNLLVPRASYEAAQNNSRAREGMIQNVAQERGVSIREAARIVDTYLGQPNATRTNFP
jgi:murein DD-endopeptidase MepM/ murein hydrolase activator NlpD